MLGAAQAGSPVDSTVKSSNRVVRTNEQTTAIGEAILKANAAEAEEAETYKKIDSTAIIQGLR